MTKISAASEITTLADTDEFAVASGGASKKITAANITAAVAKAFPLSDPSVPGLGFQNYPRVAATTSQAVLVSQRLTLVGMTLPAGLTITGITFYNAVTAISGATNQLFGIFDNDAGSMAGGAARALLRGTVDGTSAAWASHATKTLNLTSTYVTPSAGRYYIGILINATTVPTLLCTPTLAPAVVAATPYLAGSSTTTITALPNPAAAISGALSAIPYVTLT